MLQEFPLYKDITMLLMKCMAEVRGKTENVSEKVQKLQEKCVHGVIPSAIGLPQKQIALSSLVSLESLLNLQTFFI